MLVVAGCLGFQECDVPQVLHNLLRAMLKNLDWYLMSLMSQGDLINVSVVTCAYFWAMCLAETELGPSSALWNAFK